MGDEGRIDLTQTQRFEDPKYTKKYITKDVRLKKRKEQRKARKKNR